VLCSGPAAQPPERTLERLRVLLRRGNDSLRRPLPRGLGRTRLLVRSEEVLVGLGLGGLLLGVALRRLLLCELRVSASSFVSCVTAC